ncbi:hypothetical protein OSB04_024416 [Centaurea solstitialis]|uniref:Uncharacterized protein n=1 Tax=Centaurea solstitialis TaxID=347529 RepID=A0AA38SL32_9ASTR|nr:hypothetical protein OSB04_024416 [Centaurea solstitialis]
MKKEITEIVTQQARTATRGRVNKVGSTQSGHTRNVTFKPFRVCQPPNFQGEKDPVISSSSVEVKVRFAANLLRKTAKDWWNVVSVLVSEITEKFLEKSHFRQDYVANETMKMYRYGQMLKAEIRVFVLMANCQNFHQMFVRARAREIELER